jgi:group I intron endonuclease
MTCGIYCIRCLINHNEYIGLSFDIENRWSVHISELRGNYHCNNYLQNSWNKYGEENFEFYILEECEKEKLCELEMFYIDKLKTKIPNGFNITDGGEGLSGFHHSDETKEKLSIMERGDKNPFYGKHHSEESKKKSSEKHMGQPAWNKGIPRPDYIKDIISKANTGRIVTIEQRKKLSVANKGKKRNNATSSYHGVSFDKTRNKWFAFLYNKKLRNLGRYDLEIDAARAYDKYVIENNLSNPLNFPEDYNRREVD